MRAILPGDGHIRDLQHTDRFSVVRAVQDMEAWWLTARLNRIGTWVSRLLFKDLTAIDRRDLNGNAAVPLCSCSASQSCRRARLHPVSKSLGGVSGNKRVIDITG